MPAAAGTDSVERPRYCANHPKVETYVSCSNCGKPICPDCMVQAAVGIKCRDCAKLPRSARVTLKPEVAAKAVAAAFAVGSGFGVVLAVVGGYGLGFFTFVIAYFVGLMTGRAVLSAAGRYRAPGGKGSTPFGEQHNIKLEERKRLIRQLARRLNLLMGDEDVESCYLAASKGIDRQILGALSPAAHAKIKRNLPADLIKTSKAKLLHYFGLRPEKPPVSAARSMNGAGRGFRTSL